MGSEDIKAEVHVEMSDDASFNDWNHMVNFLNYMFRTDKAQKHTNDKTSDNLVVFNIGNDEGEPFNIVRADSLKMRTFIKDSTVDIIERLVGHDYHKVLNDLTYFQVLVSNDGDEFDIASRLPNDHLEQTIHTILSNVIELDDYILWVLHCDQEDYHLHGLKINK